MLATLHTMAAPAAAPSSPRFTKQLASSRRPAKRASRSLLRKVSLSPRSVDLAGRTVRLSPAVPAGFDASLASHHHALGRWVAEQADVGDQLTRGEARKLIEGTFQHQVLGILGVNTLADLRVVVLAGDGAELPPAIAIICDSVGQIDLGWIEQTNVLSNTLFGSVAPVGWRAAAYSALGKLALVLPLFGFDDMMDELSAYYWDGETTDEGASHALVEYFGQDPESITLPSHIRDRRPDFMLAENAAPMKALPASLRAKLRRLSAAHDAVKKGWREGSAWFFDRCEVSNYLPEYEDASYLPPMTTVPFDAFAQELDEVGRLGMETAFFNIAGLCPLSEDGALEQWFATLRLGAELITAAQDLIDFNPAEALR